MKKIIALFALFAALGGVCFASGPVVIGTLDCKLVAITQGEQFREI